MGGSRKRAQLFLGATIFVGLAAPAWASPSAQTDATPLQPTQLAAAGAGGGASNKNVIQEVVVTARRTAERVQDVPLSVTAVSGETLRRNSVTAVGDLYKISPSLTINPAANRPATIAVRIRSIAEQSGALGQDPTVPIYFAEAVINRQTGVTGSLFDLASVQVIKGPQGTLFGRSATGGAVLITPVRPTDRFGGYVTGTYGLYQRRELEGALNVPLAQGLAFRLSAKTAHRDGDIQNLFPGPSLGGGHTDAVRASLVWSPTETFDTYFVADTTALGGSPSPSYGISYQPGSPAVRIFPGLIPYVQGRQDEGIETTSLNAPQSLHVTNRGLTNITEFKLESVTLKNIANMRRIVAKEQVDGDGTPFPILAVADIFKTVQYSEEFQALGKAFDNRLNYVAGINYFKELNRQINYTSIFGGRPATADAQPRNLSRAVFAQGTYEIVPRVRFTAGLRYTWDERALTTTQRTSTGGCALFDVNNVPLPEPCSKSVVTSFKAPSYTVGLDYKPSPDVMFYIEHRRGYRTGGFTASAARAVEFTPFQPEIVKDVEGGSKVDWHVGDMPIRTDLAIFYSDYTDIQRTLGNISPGGVLTQRIFNAAAATIKGGEFEFNMKPTSALEIYGYFAASIARYQKFVNPETGQDLSSNRFGAAPDYMGRIAIDYTLPFSSPDIGDFHLSAAYRGQSVIRIGDTNEIGVEQPAYGVTDFRIDWVNVGSRPLTLSAFVTNAFDTNYIANGVPLKSAIGVTPVVYGERRMAGVTARYAFGND